MARPRTPPVINPQAYSPTVWQDGVTPVNASNLNKLEQGVAATAGIPADVVVTPATAHLIRNRFTAGDANPAYRLLAGGKQEWGPGGATAPDTVLYRSAIGTLKTDGALVVQNNLQVDAAGAGYSLDFGSAGDVYMAKTGPGLLYVTATDVRVNRLQVGLSDTVLYRSAAATLKTDGTFVTGAATYAATEIVARYGSATQVQIGYLGGYAGIHFGSPQDTNLYRSAAGTLKTDGAFIATGLIYSNQQVVSHEGTPASRTFIGVGAGGAGLFIGGDTGLYRSAAAVLKTDGALDATVGLTSAGYVIANNGTTKQITLWTDGAIYLGNALDTNLYRSAAGDLRTSGQFAAATYLTAQIGTANQVLIGYAAGGAAAGITFSNVADLSLYRSTAATLRLDGTLEVVNGEIRVLNASADHIRIGTGSVRHRVAADTAGIYRMALDNTTLQWGPGGASAYDVNLYRKGADNLATDDTLWVGNSVVIDANGAGVGNRLYIGSALDVSLYRSEANTLDVGGFLRVHATAAADQYAQIGSNSFRTRQSGDAPGAWRFELVNSAMYWGPGTGATDTSLYRSAAGILASSGYLFPSQGILRNIHYSNASITLSGGHAGGFLMIDPGGGTLTVTVPTDAVYNFPVGTEILISQHGAGTVVFDGAGISLGTTPGFKISAQWGVATVLKVAANFWYLYGDMKA